MYTNLKVAMMFVFRSFRLFIGMHCMQVQKYTYNLDREKKVAKIRLCDSVQSEVLERIDQAVKAISMQVLKDFIQLQSYGT